MAKISPKKNFNKFNNSLKNDMVDYNTISPVDYGTMVEAKPLFVEDQTSTLVENDNVEINYFNIFDSENQDGSHVFWSALTLLGEFYKVIIGSFLLLLVPQDPNKTSDWLLVGTLLNLVTFIFSCLLYTLEVTRELNLIMHLDENENRSNNPVEVKKRLKRLPSSVLQNLRCTDCFYKIIAWLTIIVFIANMLLSSYVILCRFLDFTTITVYITSVMFYFYKVSDVITTITQADYVYVSAYIYKKLHYNDVDAKRYTEASIAGNDVFKMVSHGEDLKSNNNVSESLMTLIRKSNSKIKSNYDSINDDVVLEGVEEGNAKGSVICVVANGNNRNITESDDDYDDGSSNRSMSSNNSSSSDQHGTINNTTSIDSSIEDINDDTCDEDNHKSIDNSEFDSLV